jgi:serine phosphatase RsbU (regulator of sigma subunit)
MFKPDTKESALLKGILNTISDGVTVIDTDLKIQYHNQIITQSFGSCVGKQCYWAYQGRNIPCENCIVLDVLKDGVERRGIVDIQLPDGKVRLLEVASAPIHDTEGTITGAVEIARDVTDQKKAQALLNKTLLESSEELDRLNSELSDAAGYVKSVLPRPITAGAICADWRFIPCSNLGGDSFGYHWIDEDHFAVYLIDVSGHGWGAALFSVSIVNAIRSHSLPATDFRNPAKVLAALNHAFPSEHHNDMFSTVWYGVLQQSSGILTYSSGGHPPGLLVAKTTDGAFEHVKLRTPGIIIGGRPKAVFENKSHEVISGSRLLLFSDDVYEMRQSDNHIWGLNNFLSFVKEATGFKASYLDAIINRAQALMHGSAFDDDVTLLEICFCDAGE